MSEIQELFDRQEITDVMHSYCKSKLSVLLSMRPLTTTEELNS